MRIMSLLATLGVLGSSSLALADHATFARIHREPAYRQPADREAFFRNRHDREPVQPAATTWQALTSLERLDRGGDVFDLATRQRFGQLRLQNQTGRTFVRSIDVVFANGERQCVPVGQLLDGNHAMVNIELDGDARRIARIVVDGRSAAGGSYQLYAM